MNSPGQYHLKVPKDPQENLRWRHHLVERCQINPRFRSKVIEACREDFFFYLNSFVWQFNPRRVGVEVEPFISWPYQDDAFRQILEAIVGQHDLVIEKSREMGATWMCLIPTDWIGKFHDHKTMGVISRDADAVDDGTMNSLLPKLDFISDHQPCWLIGDQERKTKGMVRRYLRTKSVVTGEAATGKAFVGGRCLFIFVDEFSQITEGHKVQHRTHDVTGCRIFNFTHVGSDGHAYELANRPDINKLVMHWSQHPRKNEGLYRYDPEKGHVVVLDKSYHFAPDYPFVVDGTPGGPFPGIRSPWYDKECIRRGSVREIAQDLDIDPAGSTRQFFDQPRILGLKRDYATDPHWVGELRFDELTAVPFGLDPIPSGHLSLWLTPDRDGKPPRARYCVGCDVSAGTGATNSTMAIGNMVTGEKVGEYASPNIYPDQFARLAVAICRYFQDEDGDGAILSWEIPGPGMTFTNEVAKVGYSRLYRAIDPVTHKVAPHAGWLNNNNKLLYAILRDYQAALYEGRFVNRSAIALDETLKFAWLPGGKVEHTGFAKGERDDPSGATVNHGDRVIADAQCWMLMRNEVKSAPEQNKPGEEEYPFLSYGWRRSIREQPDNDNWIDRSRCTPRDRNVTVWSGGDRSGRGAHA